LEDGRAVHHDCFRCRKCGKQTDTSDEAGVRLLRMQIGKLVEGNYECDVCSAPDHSRVENAAKVFANDLARARKEGERNQADQDERDRRRKEAADAMVAAQKAKKQAELDREAAERKAQEDVESAKKRALQEKGFWTLIELQDRAKCIQMGVLGGQKEQYLADADFQAVFGMPKQEFGKLPQWRQNKEKEKHGLF